MMPDGRMAEAEEVAIPRQQPGKHTLAATYMHRTIEEL
jgi:hypothetical protein